ncbi:MAG: signal peptidase I [Coriobacteriia bacterium]|nr:signal peptidase I [Coriobacteriia bacterium]
MSSDLSRKAQKEAQSASDTRGVTGRWLVETAALVLLAFVIAMGVRAFIVEPYRIPTESMLPTIEANDHILIYRLGTHLGSAPSQEDVVVFYDPTNIFPNLVKRVIATEGQVVDFTPEGKVLINGVAIDEPYLVTPSSTFPLQPESNLHAAIEYPFVVPDGYIFVLGDNRERSSDSRAFGPVPISEVKGVAFFTYWPLGNFATLE